MAQKKLNKNLVAFLTVAGILLTLVVVGLATGLSARKDPEFWAVKARQQAQAGDYEMAIQYFDKAYKVSRGAGGVGKDVAYKVEAAHCAYQGGDIRAALGNLDQAHAEQRSDPGVLVAYLDLNWDLLSRSGGLLLDPNRVLEYAQAMQEADENQVLGPVSEAIARWALESTAPDNRAKGDAAFQRAVALAPQDPRVLWTQIQWERRAAGERLRQAEAEGAAPAARAAIEQELQDKLVGIVKAGLAANPAEWWLVETYVVQLLSTKQGAEARAVLERALQQNEASPQLHLAYAAFARRQAYEGRDTLTPEAYAGLLAEASEHARRALALEPALYEAYNILAAVELTRDLKRAAGESVAPERYQAAVEVYDEALRRTAGVRSVQAALGEDERRLMYARAFNTALTYCGAATTRDEQDARRRLLRKMLEPAEARYPEDGFTYYMRGLTAMAEGQATPAIRAFLDAEKAAQAEPGRLYPRLWFQVFRGVLPATRLAQLYREQNQPGEALRYTEQALGQYASEAIRAVRGNQPPPLALAINRADLLNLLGRAQEAYDYVEALTQLYRDELATNEADRLRLAAIKANSLRALGRGSEAPSVIAEGGGSDAVSALLRARVAYLDGDQFTAEKLLVEVLGMSDLDRRLVPETVGLLIQVLAKKGKPDEAKQVLADLRNRFNQDGSLTRQLDEGAILLSYTDPEQQNAKLLELIAADPDPYSRALRYYIHYTQRREYARAAGYLDEMEKIRPNDPTILDAQFRVALRLEKLDRAGKYALALTALDADHAGGATYRGELALAQEKPEEAVREFRAAQGKLPRTSGLLLALGRALLSAERYQEAIGVLLEAYQLNPLDFNVNKLLYSGYQALPPDQRPADDGLSYLLKAQQLGRERQISDPFIEERAEFIDEESNPQAGIKRREEQRSAEPQNIENLIRLAQLYANPKVNDPDHAAERLQEAAKINPGHQALAQAAAEFYSKSGRRAAGEQHLRAYLEAQTGKRRGFAHLLLGRFYEALGDPAAAETAYLEAKRVLEEGVADAEERRLALQQVGFTLVDFYRRRGDRSPAMIEACRWVLDKLDVQQPREATMRSQARAAIIQGLLNLRQYGEAEQEIETYLRDYPEEVNGSVAQAQLKLAKREWEEAHRALTRVLQKVPKHLWSLLQRGQLSMRFGRYVEAKDDLAQARTLAEESRKGQPGSAEAGRAFLTVASELAELYEITEQYQLAETELRTILSVVLTLPDNAEPLQTTVERLVNLWRRANQLDKAKQLVSEFLGRYPDKPMWPYRLALVCMDQGDELTRQADAARDQGDAATERKCRVQASEAYQTAVAQLQNAEQRGTEDPALYWRCVAARLTALAAAGQAAQAVQWFEGLKVKPIPPLVGAAIIRAYSALNRRSEAQAALQGALEAASQEGTATILLVMAQARRELPPLQVVDVLRQLVERTSKDTLGGYRLRNELAMCLTGMEQGGEALRVLEPVLAKVTPNTPEWGNATLARAQALDQSGDVDGAIAIYKQLLQRSPRNPALMNNVAYVLAERANRPQEALAYAEAAREDLPRNADVLDTLGWVYFKNGRLDQAEAALKEALSIDPENVPAAYHIGRFYAERGRSADAAAALRRALTLAVSQGSVEYQKKVQAALDQLK